MPDRIFFFGRGSIRESSRRIPEVAADGADFDADEIRIKPKIRSDRDLIGDEICAICRLGLRSGSVSEPVKKSVSNQSRRLRMESETACHVVGDGEPRRSGFDLFETSNQELP